MKVLEQRLFHIARKSLRWISSTSNPANETTITSAKKKEYYNNLGSKEDDSTPPEWDKALPFKSIPGPKGIPILGNAWRFFPFIGDFHGYDFLDMQTKLYEDYGNIVTLGGSMLNDHVISIYDPEAIEICLRNEGPWPTRDSMQSLTRYRKTVRKDVFNDVIGLLGFQGKEWFNMRSTVNPILMQPRTAAVYVDTIDSVAGDLVNNMRILASKNPHGEMPKDFDNELYKWALESIGSITLERRLGCLALNLKPDSEAQILINSALKMFDLNFRLEILPGFWKYFPTPTWREFVKEMDTITFTVLKYINEVLAKMEDGQTEEHEKSILKRLLKINKEIAIATVMDLLMAGIDTTGKSLGATLYYLARYPDKQNKLREELKKLIPNKDSAITKEVLNNAPYLKAVIKETTRLSPIAIGNMRTTSKNLVLSGYQIPKGTIVVFVNLLLCHQNEHFAKAMEFIPERFLRDNTAELSHKNTNQFVFLPFGFGPRSCVGKRLANLELEVGTAKIIRNFALSWPHKDMRFQTTFLHGIGDPLKLRIKELED